MSDGGDRPAAPDDPAPATPRAKRTHRIGTRSIKRRSLTSEVMAVDALTDDDREALEGRPKTRGECSEGARPCPWVSCRHHLYLDVSPETGSIKLHFPDLEPWEMADTCALDLADRAGQDGMLLEEVAHRLNVTREGVRLIEVRGLIKLKRTTEDL